MSARPRLTSLDLWGVHERRCVELLRAALELLKVGPEVESEPELNRALYRAILRASQAVAGSPDAHAPPVVVPEGRNPPAAPDRELAEREFKIPDFYWAYIDHLAADPDAAAKQFVVECKRLSPTTKRRAFTLEYVKSGIARFISPGHGYGMGARSGAMLGYLQQIAVDTALAEVNAHAGTDSIPPLSLNSRSADDGAELEHQLARTFPESPFRLVHLWIRV